MRKFIVGDLVTRKSYNEDILFQIVKITYFKGRNNTIFRLKSMMSRLIADSREDDLIKKSGAEAERLLLTQKHSAFDNVRRAIEAAQQRNYADYCEAVDLTEAADRTGMGCRHTDGGGEDLTKASDRTGMGCRYAYGGVADEMEEAYGPDSGCHYSGGIAGTMEAVCGSDSGRRSNPDFPSDLRCRPGTILQLDSSAEFLKKSRDLYAQAGFKSYGVVLAEKYQPQAVVKYVKYFRPDVLVVTGHDGLKKGKPKHDVDSYTNSRYYIRSVAEARRVVPQREQLAIVAGACQSYYELLIDSGADFASSPGRIVINSVDPAIAAAIIAGVLDNEAVKPDVVAKATVSGPDGIWGKARNGMAECG
jgi:hypothetical protein